MQALMICFTQWLFIYVCPNFTIIQPWLARLVEIVQLKLTKRETNNLVLSESVTLTLCL
jgi:hypothetical protein